MVFGIVYSTFGLVFSVVYRVLDDRLVGNFVLFIRGFEAAIFLMAAVLFLLIAMSILLRRAKKLPSIYEIQMFDIDGREVTIDGLRRTFSTYEAAESFAREYKKAFANQYHFKVVGNMNEHQLASHT